MVYKASALKYINSYNNMNWSKSNYMDYRIMFAINKGKKEKNGYVA